MSDAAIDNTAAVRRYVAFFEQLQPAMLDQLDRYFAPGAHFRDPFNNVTGRAAICGIFRHMFRTTEAAGFRVDDWMCAGNAASICWQFHCRIRGREVSFPGMSFVRFNNKGLVEEHIDYWDPAAGIYEQLPLLGVLLRGLRRRFAASGKCSEKTTAPVGEE